MPRPENLPLDFGGPVNRSFEPISAADLAGSISIRFDAIAARFAGRLAIQDHTTSLTYAELRTFVDRIAATTQAATSGRAGPVGILLASEARYPAAMLGVLAAGRAFVPLDPSHPLERNSWIAAEAGLCAVISADSLAIGAGQIARGHIIDLDRLIGGATLTRHRSPGPGALASVYYTSGSTGTPKGIALSQFNILQRAADYTGMAHICPDDRMLVVISPSAAGAIRSIYGALLTGASLHILPSHLVQPAFLLREIRARCITVYHSVPTLVRHLADAPERDGRLDSVRFARLTGERVEWSDVDVCRRIFFDNVFVCVGLGSTESGGCCEWFVDDALRATSIRPPVGRPLPGRRITIVDDKGAPASTGGIGEIVVAGCGVALGHWQGRDLKVIPFPTDPCDPSARVLRIGDYGRWRSDGLIEFVGRKDHQIKLRGHRVEPGEIESALAKLPEVDTAAVVVRRDEGGEPRVLVAYVTLHRDACGVSRRQLQATLAENLPFYMVPSMLFVVDELPRLPNLKIDRIRLAEMDRLRQSAMRGRANEGLVAEIARMLERVVEIEGVGPDDNIASVGGNSLHAVIVASEIERQYGLALPPGFVEEHRTMGEIAEWIQARCRTVVRQNADHR